eukprot:CAMPEP_0117677760 /NCGR_PEP_ID=MMETSP0804-20121206/16915_1 /TAXON_ID=1074897 /ORGANISM="Tetraselmis astigmatica, Strain CCMP880" /LENGTH=177 /DNA_ID=CAMNT_0005487061 /DNA_START=361 /DNA_END=894 /DNA_ORIENTATION=+
MPGLSMTQLSVPCMSTAMFYATAHPSTQALLDGMVTTVTRHPEQWEMRLFQEVVLSYVVGEGDSPVLKFRILGLRRYPSFQAYVLRQKAHLPVEPLVISMGSVSPGERHDAMVKLGKWRPHHWDHGSVGRVRAADRLTSKLQDLTPQEQSKLWLAAMQAPMDGSVFVNHTDIGYLHP